MTVTNVDTNLPAFYLYPTNNNRTAWRPFGLPMIMVVPHKRTIIDEPIPNSMVFNVRIYIEDVPDYAFVAGHDHIGIKFPDRELYAKNVDSLMLADRLIDIKNADIFRDGEQVSYEDAKTGDLINYTTSTGIVDSIIFVRGADYYDLSDILLDLETLPSNDYKLCYSAQYYSRITAQNQSQSSYLCIDANNISLALYSFPIQHPGKVMDEFYRHTPPPYLTNAYKSSDTTVSLYRPFTDILQDIMDEQDLLERINWVFDTPYEAIPYLSSLLGWDLPYFPESLDQLRRAVLRRTVEFQNLKGSRRAIANIFKLFGFEILITNLWWSSDGKRLIRPGATLPEPYKSQEIQLLNIYQIDSALSDYVFNDFTEFKIPLLFRPQIKTGLDDFTAQQDGGDVTVEAYLVKAGSDAYDTLLEINNEIVTDPAKYGNNANCYIDINNNISSLDIQTAMSGKDVIGYSQILISGKMGDAVSENLVGPKPPLKLQNVKLDRELNELILTLNGYFDPKDDERFFIYIYYNKIEILVPSIIQDLQSNRFDIQVLTKSTQQLADPATLDFAIEFLYRLKAFHSLLNVIQTRIELTETYEVTDMCVGGDYEQRYDIAMGRLQVPPAIIPNIPGEINDCSKLDPKSLGYKDADILFRLRKLANMPEEHNIWKLLDNRIEDLGNAYLRLSPILPALNRDNCYFTYNGQDRIAIQDRIEDRGYEFNPTPNSNQAASGLTTNDDSPIEESQLGLFDANGAAATSNSDSSTYGGFIKEFTQIRIPLCDLDGVTDFCYKGRVDDEFLFRPTLLIDETFRSHPCRLSFGYGVYWAFPAYSIVVLDGTAKPCLDSHTLETQFSGMADGSGYKYFLSGEQGNYLNVSYKAKLPVINDSFLGRLYRDYDSPSDETIHYSNRNIPDADQCKQLALQRNSLEIQKPTMHLPGCRFAYMHALYSDFTHPEWKARPWDDQYSSYCGPNNICGDNIPSFLNYEMTVGTDGNEYLIFDDVYFSASGNGLIPDISSLGAHSLLANGITADMVIHKVYMNITQGSPAISFDQVCAYDELVDNNGILLTQSPLFSSYAKCQGVNNLYADFADGYACELGYLNYTGTDIDRSGLYEDVLEGLGIDETIAIGTPYLYNLGSGILSENGHRLDCGCLLAECEYSPTGLTGTAVTGTVGTGTVGTTGTGTGTGTGTWAWPTFTWPITGTGTGSNGTEPIPIEPITICSSALFLDNDYEYDWDTDHLRIDLNLVIDDLIDTDSFNVDGKIPTMLELM